MKEKKGKGEIFKKLGITSAPPISHNPIYVKNLEKEIQKDHTDEPVCILDDPDKEPVKKFRSSIQESQVKRDSIKTVDGNKFAEPYDGETRNSQQQVLSKLAGSGFFRRNLRYRTVAEQLDG